MFTRAIMALSLLMLFSSAMAEDFSLAPFIHPSSVANFPLTEAVLEKMEKVQDDLLHLPTEADGTENRYDTSIESLTASLEKRPKLMAILMNNKINARNYVIVYMALSAALAAAVSENEEQIFDETQAVSKENLAFGKKYANRIRKLLEE